MFLMESVLTNLKGLGVLDDAGAERVRSALAEGRPLDETLISAGAHPGGGSPAVAGGRFHLSLANLEKEKPDRDFVAGFPARLLLGHNLLPLSEANGVVRIATGRPLDRNGLDVLRLVTGKDFVPVLAPLRGNRTLPQGTLGRGRAGHGAVVGFGCGCFGHPGDQR